MLIPAIKLRLQFEASEDLYFQEYSGSTFRGNFGIQLRNLCCLTGNDKCNDCQYASSCIYKNIFEQQYITASETLETSENSKTSENELNSNTLNLNNRNANDSDYDYEAFNDGSSEAINTRILTTNSNTTIQAANTSSTHATDLKASSIVQSQKKVNIPNPYIIEPLPMNTSKVRKGELFSICVKVLGRSIEHIDSIIISFYNGALVGYGKEGKKKKARLVKVFQQDDSKDPCTERLLYYFAKNFNFLHDKSNNFRSILQKHLRSNFNYIFWEFSKISKDREVTLVFTTPLRLIDNNRVIPAEELTAEKILSTIVRRVCNFVKYNLTNTQKEKFVVHHKNIDDRKLSDNHEFIDDRKFCNHDGVAYNLAEKNIANQNQVDQNQVDLHLDNSNLVDNSIYRICIDESYLEYLYSEISSIDMTTNLKWKDWSRYSNRQKKSIGLGGNIGEITFLGNVAPFLAYILLGSFLHIGKSTVLGLGNYYIKR